MKRFFARFPFNLQKHFLPNVERRKHVKDLEPIVLYKASRVPAHHALQANMQDFVAHKNQICARSHKALVTSVQTEKLRMFSGFKLIDDEIIDLACSLDAENIVNRT